MLSKIESNEYIKVSIPHQVKNAYKFVVTSYEKEGLATHLVDLAKFIKKGKNNNTNQRKLASRLYKLGLVEYIGKGVIIPTNSNNKDVNLPLLSKIKTKQEKKSVIKNQQKILNVIKPYLLDKQNQWSNFLTIFEAKFREKWLYKKFVNESKLSPLYFIIPILDQRMPTLEAKFHVYPTYVKLKFGTFNLPIQASKSIIFSALSIAQNYLVEIQKFWKNFNLNIPTFENWEISIPYIFIKTLNEDYTSFGGTIKDKGLGISLLDYHNKFLYFKISLPSHKLKPSQIENLISNYTPLKMLNIDDVSKLPNFRAHLVTLQDHGVTKPISKDEIKKIKGEKK